MDREDQLIGEIIAARSMAQGLCFLLVQTGVLPREKVENQITAAIAVHSEQSNGENPKEALHAGISAIRLTEFLEDFRRLLGGTVQ